MSMFHRRHIVLTLVASLLWSLPALGEPAATAKYPDTTDGLQQFMRDIYNATNHNERAKADALIRTLFLPNHESWFKAKFGDAVGGELGKEYSKFLPRMEGELGRLFVKIVKNGQSNIEVLKFDKPTDPKAVGFQKSALAAMKQPQPIYSVRFVKPGEKRGMHVYSFVYVDGGFRLAGKMRSVKTGA